jgi:hypothetical protein
LAIGLSGIIAFTSQAPSTGKIVFSSDDCKDVPPPPCNSGNFLMNADGSGIRRLPMIAGDLDWRLPAT